MTDTTENAIRIAEEARLSAMCAGDAAALEAMLAEEFVYTHANGNIDSKESLIARIAAGTTRHSDAVLVDFSSRLYGDMAVGHGHFTMTVESPTYKVALDNLFLCVWVRRAGSWQQVALQSSPRKKN